MKVCVYCGPENRSGLLYCLYCGQELAESESGSQTSTDRGLKAITLPGGRRIVLGRLDDESSVQPDLDLSSFGALEGGVSRHHAAIDFVDISPTLTDLGSKNGTYINGKQLSPHQSRILSHGDEIRLGKLLMYISL
jgi:pSer/pThr/pTyr-binding forkhead associated (FHA) protein